VDTDHQRWSAPRQIALSPDHSAEVAVSIAFTFERLAATYRRMAERTHSRHEAARLLGHVARLEDEAKHERLEAIRLQHLVEP
jgi:hypothetical protein